jgi:hypothetical protein
MTAHRTSADLDVYEIAFLAGGPDRMVDAALVALVESGRVRVHSPGELATVALARRHPVEAAVLDAIGPAGHRSVDTVRWRLTTDDRMLDVGRRLRAEGLLGGVPVPRRSGRRLAATYAGRHLLRDLVTVPPADRVAAGTSAMTVALRGREAMPDRALCASIFDQPPSRPSTDGGAAGPHELEYADGWDAARRTKANVVADYQRLGTWMGG